MPRRILISRAYQLATDPESPVRMQFSGRSGRKLPEYPLWIKRICRAHRRASSTFHERRHSLIFCAMKFLFCSSSGSNARRLKALSPTMLTSIGYRRLSIAPSMSISRRAPRLASVKTQNTGKPDPTISKVSHSFIKSQLGLVPRRPSDPVTKGTSSATAALPSSAFAIPAPQFLSHREYLIGRLQRTGAHQHRDFFTGVQDIGGSLQSLGVGGLAQGPRNRHPYGWSPWAIGGIFVRQQLQIIRQDDARDRAPSCAQCVPHDR